MSLKIFSDYPAYNGFYHFIAATKYRNNMFLAEERRTELEKIISNICKRMDDLELREITIAYNHVYILVQTTQDVSKVGKALFGASSRNMRQTYPELITEATKGLWGGTSVKAIKDENHLQNCLSYIQRHRPDNTKID